MKTRVRDSWAILEWTSGRQPGTESFGNCSPRRKKAKPVLLKAMNAGEVYAFLRKQHRETLGLAWP
ncbi:MAG: hypothetical protein KGM92_10845 [Acidobacteriota bacterium]|nr:hypothetical protein [Acidobacteriota bacterium]